MADLTYTAIGHFYMATKTMKASLYIPKEDVRNPYLFGYNYDISKQIAGGYINAVFCHIALTRDPGNEMVATDYNYDLQIAIDKLAEFPAGKNTRFDFRIKESLLIIYHDDVLNMEDVQAIYDNLEKVYALLEDADEDVISIKLEDIADIHNLKPKRLGVSIIRA